MRLLRATGLGCGARSDLVRVLRGRAQAQPYSGAPETGAVRYPSLSRLPGGTRQVARVAKGSGL